MRVLPTYGAVLRRPLRDPDDSHQQHVIDQPGGRIAWVERMHHPPEVDRRDCMVGPVSVVLRNGDADPGRDPVELFDLDPSTRSGAAGAAALLLAADAECRLMWDGRRAAISGAGEEVDRLRSALKEEGADEQPAVPVAAPRMRPRGARAKSRAFPARTRRRVEYERELRRLAPRLAEAGMRLRSWGAVITAAAVEGLSAEIVDPQSGLSRPREASAVAIAEDRIGGLVAALAAPTSPPRVPTLVEAAADAYVAALAGRQEVLGQVFAFFGSSLKLHVPVEREGFIELPAKFAESLGAWPLAALPLARHELDPLGLREPPATALAARCHQLAGDQFRYALERWGVGDPGLEQKLLAAMPKTAPPADGELPEPMSRIATLVSAAEAGEGYVNETELMLLLAAAW